jgi:hypothetical protein
MCRPIPLSPDHLGNAPGIATSGAPTGPSSPLGVSMLGGVLASERWLSVCLIVPPMA